MQKPVNIAVCGKFHILNYIAFLEELNIINHVYFSHKPKTAFDYGISSSVARNYPLKEFLLQAMGRIINPQVNEQLFPIYAHIWEVAVRQDLSDSPVLHILSNGACLSLVEKAKRKGARIMAEVVNTHPDNSRSILAKEAETWGCRPSTRLLSDGDKRLLAEIHQSDVILAPSRTVAKSFLSRDINKRTEIIPYAANLGRFYPEEGTIETRSASKEKLKIICVGQVILRKGQLYLLEAARRLGIKITLVGVIAPSIQPLLNRYKDYFDHIERVPNDQMRSVLCQHDVFVLPSLEEGLAVAVCEAMACGLSVITTRESGGEELIEDGINGFLVEAASVDALVDKINTLSKDRDTVVAVGRKAAESTRAEYNWNQYAKLLVKVYESLL